MSKHTPGNWVAKPMDSADWIDLVTDDPETCGGSAHSLPFVSCRHFNQEANARLIAAAPDLLAVSEDMLAVLEARGADGPAMDRARAVIAKAKALD